MRRSHSSYDVGGDSSLLYQPETAVGGSTHCPSIDAGEEKMSRPIAIFVFADATRLGPDTGGGPSILCQPETPSEGSMQCPTRALWLSSDVSPVFYHFVLSTNNVHSDRMIKACLKQWGYLKNAKKEYWHFLMLLHQERGKLSTVCDVPGLYLS